MTKNEEHYTYRDYKTWPNDERWELIDGTAWAMAGPNRRHQEIAGFLYFQLRLFLEGKPCRPYIAPLDILFPKSNEADDDVDTVVQPDLSVFCDTSKLTFAGARGAPDLVVEILSPWTSRKDLNEKFRLYERSGVREYWIVDPASRSVQFYLLAGGKFVEALIAERIGRIESHVLQGFGLDLERLFEES